MGKNRKKPRKAGERRASMRRYSSTMVRVPSKINTEGMRNLYHRDLAIEADKLVMGMDKRLDTSAFLARLEMLGINRIRDNHEVLIHTARMRRLLFNGRLPLTEENGKQVGWDPVVFVLEWQAIKVFTEESEAQVKMEVKISIPYRNRDRAIERHSDGRIQWNESCVIAT